MLTIHTPTNIALQENEVYVRSEADNFQDEWPVHTHNGYEIHYFIQGDATFLIGDRIYKPLPGDMFIFRGGVPHRINPSREIVYKRSFVNFTELMLLDMLGMSQLDNLMSIFRHANGLLVHWSLEEREYIIGIFKGIKEEMDAGNTGYKTMVKLSLTQLLLRIYRKMSSERSVNPSLCSSQKQTSVSRVLHYLNQNYTENVSLDDLSKTLHLNKYYICHSFKETTGYTISNYVIRKRVAEAKKLLLSTDTPILSISETLGFNTPVYFSRAFKQYVGVSPQLFRKNELLNEAKNH
ncbi:AraC family transcriptional regulator [Chryseobacterium mucoviscidosis]|uniref:AraC family transcriptional regulator n=1 Tax=unclassified Paenibacillus TaxID=185978 RepID=UPI0009A3D9E2|nr:AraC family transcriptional regulator [Paenibacillus sp. 11B]MDN8589497.1 AraC family transcriptional regulator [Paenibacillus sp. 11B]OPG99629.1 AraC family transcriptional regulator [Chryseobacterium mucoviscidosis]